MAFWEIRLSGGSYGLKPYRSTLFRFNRTQLISQVPTRKDNKNEKRY